MVATMENLVGLAEAAAILGIVSKGKRPGYRLRDGIMRYGWDIPYVRVGRLIKFRPADLDAWVARRLENGIPVKLVRARGRG